MGFAGLAHARYSAGFARAGNCGKLAGLGGETQMARKPTEDEIRAMVLPNGRTIGQELAALDAVSRLLDSRFGMMGVNFGLDSVLGLVPIAGDVATGAAGLHALVTAWRLKLPASASVGIVWNLVFDTAVGSVPVAGDVFDIFFQSNRKNFRIVQKHLIRRAEAHAASAGARPVRTRN
jgi:hypothetical protein